MCPPPSLSERFKSLSKKVERRFKKEGLGEDVVDEAITLTLSIPERIQQLLKI